MLPIKQINYVTTFWEQVAISNGIASYVREPQQKTFVTLSKF